MVAILKNSTKQIYGSMKNIETMAA